MAARTNDLSHIDRLRQLASRLAEINDPDAAWIGGSLAVYEAGASEGVTLCSALGIAPAPGQEGWWTREGRIRRDTLLCEMGNRFYANEPSETKQAIKINKRLKRFAAGARQWQPGSEEELCHYLTTEDGKALSVRTIQRALAAGRACQMLTSIDGMRSGISSTS
jgi:hypothetical protein